MAGNKKQKLPIIDSPESGLPEDIFEFITRLTPIVNVDLLVYNKKRQFVLTWREKDQFQKGWHIPGSIVRFKEPQEDRLKKLIEVELCGMLLDKPVLKCIFEIILNKERNNRGHFISFLYTATALTPITAEMLDKIEGKIFNEFPSELIPVHQIYHEILSKSKPKGRIVADFGKANLIYLK